MARAVNRAVAEAERQAPPPPLIRGGTIDVHDLPPPPRKPKPTDPEPTSGFFAWMESLMKFGVNQALDLGRAMQHIYPRINADAARPGETARA